MRAIFYDTETTGIRPSTDRVIEIAAYDPERQKSFERLINPGCPIPKEATEIHKITNEMVANAPTFQQVAKEFREFCEGDVVLIAHNNDAFDALFIKNEYQLCGEPFLSCKFLDSLKWARRYRQDLPRHTLQSLREVYGIPPNNAHRALDDVIVLHQVFSLMTVGLSIHKAYDLLNQTRDLKQMPFGKHQGQPLDKVPKNYVSWLKKSGAFDKKENLPLYEAFQKLNLISSM